MTLPILKILGHALAKSDWSDHSKIVVWSACCVGFFGSFRFGELLSSKKDSFNAFETLVWKDIRFVDGNSIMIHNKIPKTRTASGEFVSLFEFSGHNCCPVTAIKCLKKLSNPDQESPVFKFENGSFLTKDLMNVYIVHFLKPHLGNEASSYSCRSFRAALPSALAAHPILENDVSIKRWGRWNSNAFERYTRLSHKAKRELFCKFTSALNDLS